LASLTLLRHEGAHGGSFTELNTGLDHLGLVAASRGASVELARICRTWNIGLSMHSNSHMGISLAAITHLAAAVPNLTFACDTHYPWQAEEIVGGGKLRFEDGALLVPTGPGLGVELDRAQLKRMHEQYLAAGIEHRDDEIEMQKVDPGWKRKLPRWLDP
jgi:glucarate dehydratase